MYSHIKECWAAIHEANSIEEVNELIKNFPRWSGDWEIMLEKYDDEEESHYVLVNSYWDPLAEDIESDEEELPFEVPEGL